MQYKPRPFYINKIRTYIGKNIIKVLVGQRRVGKSYMMYQLIDELKKSDPDVNCIYINKELHEFDHISDHNQLINYIENKKTGKHNAVLIDEVQDIMQFEKALRSLQADGKYDIYCTGSNAMMLSGELATFLSGRYVEIKIYTLSYTEFLDFHGLPDTEHVMFRYIQYGGLPGLIHIPLQNEIVYDYLQNIYAAILFKDIIKRHNIRNVNFLENLVYYAGDNLGSIVSGKKISDFLKSQNIKISPNVVLDYLHYLCSAFFLFKVQRADVSGKKIFEIGEKYYFEDLGLRNSITGYKPGDIHKIMENIVYLHLRRLGYTINIGMLGNKEIDFVCGKNGEKLYVQVCYLLHDEKTVEREFGNLLGISDNYPKIVVSLDKAYATGSFKGITHYYLKDFLIREEIW